MKLLMIVCISLAMAGCFKSEEEVKQERKEEVLKQIFNQKRDHRSLEQKVLDAQARKKNSNEVLAQIYQGACTKVRTYDEIKRGEPCK